MLIRLLTRLLLAVLLLGGAASGAHAYELTLSAEALTRALAGHFPLQADGPLGSVRLSDPRVRLSPASPRLGFETALAGTTATGMVLKGRAVFDGEIGYDPVRRQLLLREPRLRRLDVDGLDEPFAGMLAELSAGLLQQQLPMVLLVPLPDGDPALDALSRALRGVSVRGGMLVLDFGL
jgi:hypothetical protein